MAGFWQTQKILCFTALVLVLVACQASPSEAFLRSHGSGANEVTNNFLSESKSAASSEELLFSVEPKNRFTSFIGDVSQRLRNFLQRIPIRSTSANNKRRTEKIGAASGVEDPFNVPYESNQPMDPFAAHLEHAGPGSSSANHAANQHEGAAGNKYAGSPRLFSLFSPFNPLNPFQPLFTEVQNKDSLLRKLMKLPSLAAAPIARPAGAAGTGGTVQFLQTKDKKDLIVVVAFAFVNPAFAAGNYRVEVRSGRSNVCANAGGVYNPSGLFDGGVITRTLTGTVANNVVRGHGVFRVDPKIATLYGFETIVGKTVALVDSAGTEACGIIATAT